MLFRACCPNAGCGRYFEIEGVRLGVRSICPACRQPFQPSAPFGPAELDRTIRYHLLGRIGGGGMGEVFRAWDYRLDRQVALKVPREASPRSREVLDRFRIEVEAVERLNHESLCKLLDHDVEHVPPFLTMEFLEKGSLEDRIHAYRGSPVTDVLGLVRMLALGLEHAHRHGVVHRDIKPTNVLFGADDRPRIADFGLALLTDRPLDARITEVHQVVGSLLYMSPEQVEGERGSIDRSTDIYSLGVLMFRLLTGEFPYRNPVDDQNRSSIVQEIRDGLTVIPSSLRGEIDGRIDDVFRKATHREPSRRYHSMSALADDLGEVLGVGATPTVIRIQQLTDRATSDLSPTEALSPSAGHLILARIPSGSFEMGSSANDFGDETPVRRVTLTHDFLLGVFPVTQGQYRRLMGAAARPYFDGNDSVPMENVTWLDAVHFCNALGEVEGLPPYYRIDGERVSCLGGPGYRLPTEAEWEYACRAGSAGAYHFGDDPALLSEHAWFQDNSRDSVQPVGFWSANLFGLHDMHGNVWEWCWDWYGPYDPAACVDPAGPVWGTARVLRGGSWSDPAPSLRSAARVSWIPNDTEMTAWRFGFRVARDPDPGR
jgi:formylglycine-generating enzyme required for sulfatase activity